MLSKLLKFLFLGMALTFTSSGFAQIQESHVKKQNPDQNEFLKEELKLSDEEIQLFFTNFKEYTNLLKTVRLDRSLDRSLKTIKMAEAKEEYYGNLKSFLTKEQFSKYLKAYDGSLKATDRNQKVD